MANLFLRKPFDKLVAEADAHGLTLKRTLGPFNLIALGIGAIIGAGLFVRHGRGDRRLRGPVGHDRLHRSRASAARSPGLCYAEFASMIPIAGSAYTYAYATMGELMAWIIGWDLVLEYAIGAATVAIAWSEYFNSFLGYFGLRVPYAWCHAPSEHMIDPATHERIHGIMNVPALCILLLLTLRPHSRHQGVGARERGHRRHQGHHRDPRDRARLGLHEPGQPHAVHPRAHEIHRQARASPTPTAASWGILNAAGIVFFAFIGFDAVSTTAQEAKNPKRDMPIGILGSLVVCTVLYVLFAHVLSGIATVEDFRTQGREASVAFAISKYMHGYEWLSKFVTVAILGGFSSVILVMLLGQSRVFYSMSRDGLVSPIFSERPPEVPHAVEVEHDCSSSSRPASPRSSPRTSSAT